MCTGCSACKEICPTKAITMEVDDRGFLYPIIDNSLCINCKKCEQKCPNNIDFNYSIDFDSRKAYALCNKDDDIRSKSVSGGAFSVFAKNIIDKGGSVYGAMYDPQLNVIHGRATTFEDVDKFRGSKYVQSDIRESYSLIKKDIDDELPVLFTGVPCQTAGIVAFFNYKVPDNLFLIDILCHSCPSPKVFKGHLDFIEDKFGEKITRYRCRSKNKGWRGHNETVELSKSGLVKKNYMAIQLYSIFFGSTLIARPSCNNCKFAYKTKYSDITIGDFWGIENFHPQLDDNKGTSCVMINTSKGDNLFSEITENINFIESTTKKMFNSNHTVAIPLRADNERFWEDFNNNGYLFVAKKYANYTTLGKAKWHGKNILRPIKNKLFR